MQLIKTSSPSSAYKRERDKAKDKFRLLDTFIIQI